jgi:DnaJ-class molecular chaperone
MTLHTILTTGVVITIIMFTLGYCGGCVYEPFVVCRRCRGTGRRQRGIPGFCHPCRGTGRRLRTGRRLANLLTRARHDANH